MVATFLIVKEHNLLKEVNKIINPIIKKVKTLTNKKKNKLQKQKLITY